MKIENRVEALELELKILKNEIQSTLLEVREQILNHYYPELRAEEPARAKHSAARPGDARASKGGPERSNSNSRTQVAGGSSSAIETKVQIQPFSDIFLQDMQDLEDDDDLDSDAIANNYREDDMDHEPDYEADDEMDDEMNHDVTPPSRSMPKTREVVLQQLKQSAAVPKAKLRNRQEKVEPVEQKTSRRSFAALAAWVGDSVAKVGKERTIQVVETYAASGGALSDETKSSILQLASLASDVEPANPVGNQEMIGLMVGLDQILGEQ